MVRHIRYALSLPLLGLQKLVMGFGILCGILIRVLAKLQRGAGVHVFWPIVVAKRFVRGVPTWVVNDLLYNNTQPWTDKHRAVADADPRVYKVVCNCGGKGCINGEYRIRPPSLLVPLDALSGDMRAELKRGIATQREELAKKGLVIPRLPIEDELDKSDGNATTKEP